MANIAKKGLIILFACFFLAPAWSQDVSRYREGLHKEFLGRGKTNPPMTVVVYGLDMNKIGYSVFSVGTLRKLVEWITGPLKRSDPSFSPDVEAIINAEMEENREYEVRYGHSAERLAKSPEFLIARLRQVEPYNSDIILLKWSRDPDDSRREVKRICQGLHRLFDKAVEEKRPFHVVGYSWGTMLTYEALVMAEKEKTPLLVDSYITFGSPLVPTAFITKYFVFYERITQSLEKTIHKPENVLLWNNMFCRFDKFSGLIKSADTNVRVDVDMDTYLSRLESINDDANHDEADKEIGAIKDSFMWHESYFVPVRLPFPVLDLAYYLDAATIYRNILFPNWTPAFSN
jgi:pimeloyl-ACP methyl ester carboxylesterase